MWKIFDKKFLKVLENSWKEISAKFKNIWKNLKLILSELFEDFGKIMRTIFSKFSWYYNFRGNFVGNLKQILEKF